MGTWLKANVVLVVLYPRRSPSRFQGFQNGSWTGKWLFFPPSSLLLDLNLGYSILGHMPKIAKKR